ncbi:MAG: alkaline phosphatase D family protein [Solirubrobacteraceae bacterium]
MPTNLSRRIALLGAALTTGALLAGPAAAGAASGSAFQYGVAAGDVSSSSALLWSRPGSAGPTTLQVARSRSFSGAALYKGSASAARDYTLTIRATGLKAGARYYYRFRKGSKVSATGTFKTAPAPNANVPVSFAYSGDADAQPQSKATPKTDGSGKPFWNAFQVYGRMAAEHNDFNVNFGDTIYSDTEVQCGGSPCAPAALTPAAKWLKYKMNIVRPPLMKLRESGTLYNHWDDHEFINDYTGEGKTGAKLYKDSVAAFLSYQPTTWTAKNGLYRSFRWGKNVEVFLLDEITFRSAKASDGGTCDNPISKSPDLAPTGPAATRALFSALVPSFAAPVSQACLDRINSPKRTLLGSRQYAAFTKAIKASTAKWKVVMNEKPIQQFYALPYDRWEGYAAERQKLITFLDRNVKNAVFLTTDTHANFFNNVRYDTLPTPKNSSLTEAVTGPVATANFALEIDQATGNANAGSLITSVFFKGDPPNGVGMQCANSDTFSYSQVVANSRTLTVKAKDINGKPVTDAKTKAPCVLTLTAK